MAKDSPTKAPKVKGGTEKPKKLKKPKTKKPKMEDKAVSNPARSLFPPASVPAV